MTPSTWVPLLVAGVLLLQVVIWVPIIVVMRGRSRARFAQINAEMAALRGTAEYPLIAPQRAIMRTGHISSIAIVALTSERILVAASSRRDIALRDVISARDDASFHSSWQGERRWVIVQTGAGEIGFALASSTSALWISTLRPILAARAGAA